VLATPPLPDAEPAPPSAGDLTLASADFGHRHDIHGTAKPGDAIEFVNLSTAARDRRGLDTPTVLATADAQGNFSARVQDLQRGDQLRFRARGPDGTEGPWLALRYEGTPHRTRFPLVNFQDTLFAPTGDGTVAVAQLDDRPVAEPGDTVRFVNRRTGEHFDMATTADGGVPPGFTLQGQPGDIFDIAASDGIVNTDFAKPVWDRLVLGYWPTNVPPDGRNLPMTPFHGPLFAPGGPDPYDVRQGALGDCYLASTLASIAEQRPDVIENMITNNKNGTYTVRFYDGGRPDAPVDVTVDNRLFRAGALGPVFGASDDTPDTTKKMEMWYPIVEKAYAQWKGGYAVVGAGSLPAIALGEVTGAPSHGYSLTTTPENLVGDEVATDPDEVFATLKDALATKRPVVAYTYCLAHPEFFADPNGLASAHAYSIIGTSEQNGERTVTIRNPWASGVPAGVGVPAGEADARGGGIFHMPLAEFMQKFEQFSVGAA
jgi:hypothetical protein